MKKSIKSNKSNKTKKSAKIDFIPYNPQDRTEYLTGFHTRKLAKKSLAISKKKRHLKAEKLEFKRLKRESLASKISIVEQDYDLINSVNQKEFCLLEEKVSKDSKISISTPTIL